MDAVSGPRSSDRAMRRVAGFSLLVMAVLAGWANFAVFESQIIDGDATATAANILESETIFRFGILAFLIVGVLDLIVALSLNEVLRHGAPQFSMLAAAFRYVYGGILIVATGFLVVGADVATSNGENVDTAALKTWLDG